MNSSWDDLLDILLSHDDTESDLATEILSSDRPKKILSQALPSFPGPSNNSKTAFDTATSGITSSPNDLYSINELKQDALWLSKQANLDELEALRVTLLEWQYRPESRLQEGYSDAEVASLKDALGSDYVDKMFQGREGLVTRDDSDFASQTSRRFRIAYRHMRQQVLALQIRKELLDSSLLLDSVAPVQRVPPKLVADLVTIEKQPLADEVAVGVDRIRAQLKQLESAPSWDLDEPQLSMVKDKLDTTSLQIIDTTLEILFLRVRSSDTVVPASETVLLWLQLMASVGFFSTFNSEIDAQLTAIRKIQSTAALLTMSLFNLASTVAILNETASSGQATQSSHQIEYVFDVESAHEIHELLLNQAILGNVHAGLAVLAWAIIVHQIRQTALVIKENRESHHVQKTIEGVATYDAATGRRSSVGSGSFQHTIFEELLDRIITNNATEDPSSLLLDAVVDRCHVFDYVMALGASTGDAVTSLSAYRLQALQELISVSQSFLGYTPDLVSAELALLSPDSSRCEEKRLYDPTIEFIEDKLLLEGFFDVSAARFPYECLPFLRFCRALAKAPIFDDHGTQYIEYRLRNLTSFTQAAIKGIEYRTTREDEIGSFVALNKPVNLLDLTQNKLLTYSYQESESTSIIPADTVGELISDPDSSPKVIRWHCEFSCLAYMGQLLELHYMGLLSTSLSQFEDREAVVSEIIGTLGTLLSTTLMATSYGQSDDAVQIHCSAILDEVSSHLNPEADVITYIFDILEQELQSFRRRSVSTFDCRILISCLGFINVLTNIRPRLVWSGINRTSLLGRQSTSALILGVVTSVEVPLRNFEFLEAFVRLYQSLIHIAITNPDDGALGIDGASKMKRRSNVPATWRIQNLILLAATEIIFQTFREIPEWTFQDPAQRIRIESLITNSFSEILRYAFDVGESMSSFTGASVSFAESAKYLVTSFRTMNVEGAGVDPIIRSLFMAGVGQKSIWVGENDLHGYFGSTLSFIALMSRYGQLQNLPLSSAELQTFNSMASLVRILQTGPLLRVPCLKLIRSIMVYVDLHQPSSLLSHLGSSSCADLLHVLRHIDQKSKSPEERAEVWKVLTMMVKSSQQWLAMVLLTGAAPDSSKKAKVEESPSKCLRGKTFLQTAMNELKDIESLPQKVAISLLEFVLEAQQNWPWVTTDLNSLEDFIPKIVAFVTNSDTSRSDEVTLAYQNLIATYVTDISTTLLHHAKISRDIKVMKTFIPLVNWLTSNAVEVSSYNTSLHANLRKNFSSKYSWLSVSDIKRTGLTEREYGLNFFYDIDYADKLFSDDSYWHGARGTSSNQSFSAEFRRANTNLSVVDSELRLLVKLQRLCIDHCKFFVQDREIQKAMAHIIRNCVLANCQVYPAEAIFDTLFQTRVDISMALLRELVAVGARGSDFVGLLEPAWNAVRFRNGSYEKAIINGDLIYWRSTLYTLLMTLHFHVNKKQKTMTGPGTNAAVVALDPENTIFLEISTKVVAEGFKSAVAALQDQKQKKLSTIVDDENNLIGPRDIALLTTIMQVILRLPSLPQFSAELSEMMSSSGITSSCLLLYSWSHLLTGPEPDNQPRYADFCVQLLTSLSSLTSVAEELAIEGVLNRILSSKTTESLQRVPGGASHLDPRLSCGFLYRVWATGFLPLCLNLLHGVSGAIAAEISFFLNQFPNQLARASTSFMLTPQTRAEGTDVLTLTVASEAATLALISYILSSFREAGASAAVDSTAISDLKGYDEHRKAIAEDVRDVLALKEDARRKMTVPTDERELNWQSAKDGDKLDPKIVKELKMALTSLGRDDDEDEK